MARAWISAAALPRQIFKESESLDRYSCIKCESLLQDPVQLSCGHRMYKHCADELIDNTEEIPLCPECGDEISEEDGAKVKLIDRDSHINIKPSIASFIILNYTCIL